jgi:tRNA A37 threonylcarbamoyladenosine dehydratase
MICARKRDLKHTNYMEDVMNKNQFTRSEMVFGSEGLEKLNNATVAVFGVGGVGSFTVEALARVGVGHLVLIDFDTVDITNVNRQLHAFPDNVGASKVQLMQERVKRINPEIQVTIYEEKYTAQTAERIFNPDWDYVVDAIDMVSSKLDLIERCWKHGLPVISSMGTGNKMDPTRFQIIDISKTHTCPLAKVMRKELKVRGVKKLNVCFSDEPPVKPLPLDLNKEDERKQTPGSVAFVPSVAGMICASKVVSDIIDWIGKK